MKVNLLDGKPKTANWKARSSNGQENAELWNDRMGPPPLNKTETGTDRNRKRKENPHAHLGVSVPAKLLMEMAPAQLKGFTPHACVCVCVTAVMLLGCCNDPPAKSEELFGGLVENPFISTKKLKCKDPTQ